MECPYCNKRNIANCHKRVLGKQQFRTAKNRQYGTRHLSSTYRSMVRNTGAITGQNGESSAPERLSLCRHSERTCGVRTRCGRKPVLQSLRTSVPLPPEAVFGPQCAATLLAQLVPQTEIQHKLADGAYVRAFQCRADSLRGPGKFGTYCTEVTVSWKTK